MSPTVTGLGYMAPSDRLSEEGLRRVGGLKDQVRSRRGGWRVAPVSGGALGTLTTTGAKDPRTVPSAAAGPYGPTFGKRNLNASTAEAVPRWHTNVSTVSGAMTPAKCYRLLRAILATAVSDGLTQTNPCRVRGAGTERSAERSIVGPKLALESADAIGARCAP